MKAAKAGEPECENAPGRDAAWLAAALRFSRGSEVRAGPPASVFPLPIGKAPAQPGSGGGRPVEDGAARGVG